MTDHKLLSKELYETLKQVRNLIDDANSVPINRYGVTMSMVDAIIQKYEQETTRGTGRTTALYMKAIAEALANPGKQVEFKDHHPHRWDSALHHQSNLVKIIGKLGYDIEVSADGKGTQVFLYNKFGL